MKLCDVFHNYTYKCGLFEDKLAASSEEHERCNRVGSIAADDSDTNNHCRFGYRGSMASPFTFVLHVGK